MTFSETSVAPDLEQAARELYASFRARFGAAPTRTFFAPGRVNLMGAHLDYNGGPVMPTAIDRGTLFALRPRTDRRAFLASTVQDGELELDLDHLPEAPARVWSDYPLGVLRHLLRERPAPGGFELMFGGTLAIGAGLSSSASICVGTAFAMGAFWELELTREACIDAALFAEREFVGVHCGIMDPYAVALTRPGHLLWLDCRDGSYDHVPLETGRVTIAVADSGVRRELAQSEFNRRVSECAAAYEALAHLAPDGSCLRDVPRELAFDHLHEIEPTLALRARHVLGEVERTFAARRALLAGDVESFGGALTQTHHSLRENFEVSIPELDFLVETAVAWPGAFGARLTGAGFGGCIVALLSPDAESGFAEHLSEAYSARYHKKTAVAFFRGDGGPREVDFG